MILKNKNVLDNFDGEQIEKFVEKILKPKIIILVVIITILLLFLIPGPFGIFFIFIYLSIVFSLKSYIKQYKFMKNFADEQNFTFERFGDHRNMFGKLFKIGHSQHVYNVIKGKYIDYPIKIFNYQYTVGGGKNSKTYRFTICEIEIAKTLFPHILLRSRTMPRYTPDVLIGKRREIKISLEDEYRKNFDLYCTENYEIETLQIFTKDLLNLIKEQGSHFSIEFSTNKIYIYEDLVITKKEQIDQLYLVVKKILEKTGPLLERLHDDFDVLHQVYRKR